MEALGKFMFPSARDTPSKPLQNLSPERVNAASRPPSTTTLSTTPTSKTTTTAPDEPQYYTSPQSPRSPPIRRLHADLFADYRPTNGPTSPKAVSTFGGLTQSPSMPEINALRAHVRTNSDVQGLVKRFEHLDVRDKDAESAERRQKVEAELRRAQIAREEAESDVRRLREEVRALNREVDEGRERERMVTKRLEVVAVRLQFSWGSLLLVLLICVRRRISGLITTRTRRKRKYTRRSCGMREKRRSSRPRRC